MKCAKCHKEIPDHSAFCLFCGAKQQQAQKAKSRGNGTGSVYQLPNKSWIAVRVLGYYIGADGKKHKKTVSKSGFKTKRDAVNGLAALGLERERQKSITLQALYQKWESTHDRGDSTMGCYHAAMNWFRSCWYMDLQYIDIDDLQDAMDDCPNGKRTKENMKTLIGLLYKFAIPRHYASLNLGQYLIVRADAAGAKQGLPAEYVQRIEKAAAEGVPYAEHILCQCFLGFRPSELLALDEQHYNAEERAFVGGSKTEAGIDRTVTVAPKIQAIIDRRITGKPEHQIFCRPDGSLLNLKAYREAFYETLQALELPNPEFKQNGVTRKTYTPHSCRHTFATMMKNVDAPDKDKLALIGHTSTEMLRKYQDVDYASLRRITDALE